jgi:hypothetical protein
MLLFHIILYKRRYYDRQLRQDLRKYWILFKREFDDIFRTMEDLTVDSTRCHLSLRVIFLINFQNSFEYSSR